MQKKPEHQEDLWTGQVKSRTAVCSYIGQQVQDQKNKQSQEEWQETMYSLCVRRQLGASEA